ncbi:MAG: ADOP family duplicated permease [Vicinamibacterales bacterium]
MTAPRPSRAARLHAWLLRRVLPSLEAADATDAALTFDRLRREAWRTSISAWLRFWFTEWRSLVGTWRAERSRPGADAGSRRAGGIGRGRAAWRDAFAHVTSDLRAGLRQFIHAPLVSAVSVLSLAVGLAVVVLVFTVVQAVLWRPLPLPGADRLVRLDYGDRTVVWSYADFRDVVARMPALASAAAVSTGPVAVTMPGGTPRRMLAEWSSDGLFAFANLPMTRGRGFAPDDPDDVVVISERLWTREFGGREAAIGSRVDVQGRPRTIVGVAPAALTSLESPVRPDVWLPIGNEARAERGMRSFHVVGRLAPGATLAQTRAQAGAAAAGLFEADPDLHRARDGRAIPVRVHEEREGRLPAADRASVVAGVAAAFGLAALILILAASNVASLLLGRASEREGEVAVRLALGAGRARIARQLLTESVVIAAAAGLAAVLVTRVALLVLVGVLSGTTPGAPALDVDATAAVFAAAIAFGSVAFFGLAPALQGARTDVMSPLRRQGGTVAPPRLRLRRAIVSAQVTGAALLIVAALVFLQSERHARAIDVGFDPDGVAVVSVDLEQGHYADGDIRAFLDTATRMLEADRDTAAVAWAGSVPLSGSSSAAGGLRVEGYQPSPGEMVSAGTNVVSAGYFRLLRIPILRGREFTTEDRAGAPPVVVINDAFRRRYWPDADPIGRTIGDATVVGVAGDIRAESLADADRPFMWTPMGQSLPHRLVAHVRTDADEAATGGRLARAIGAIDSSLIVDGQAMRDVTGAAFVAQRIVTMVFGVAGFAAIGMAMMGVYGVLAYLVSLRTREFGIRVALGAAPATLLRQTMAEGLRLTVPGAVAGLAAGTAMAFAVRSMLVGVAPIDPVALAAGLALIGAAAALAALVPARRAARTDPIVSLRQQ